MTDSLADLESADVRSLLGGSVKFHLFVARILLAPSAHPVAPASLAVLEVPDLRQVAHLYSLVFARSVEKAVPRRVQLESRCLRIVPGSHDHDCLETFEGLPPPSVQTIPDRGGCFECLDVGRGPEVGGEPEASPVVLGRAVPHTRVGDAGRSKVGS